MGELEEINDVAANAEQPELIDTTMPGIMTLKDFDSPEKSLERLRDIGNQMAEEYLRQVEQFEKIVPIVVVTNGGLIPTIFLFEALNRIQPNLIPSIITLSKDPNNKGKYISSSDNIDKQSPVFIPEDIVDQGHTLEILERNWNEVLYSPISKKVSTNYPTELMIPSGVILPDLWVLSGFGMNSGHFPSEYALSKGLSEEYCAKIASLERTAGKFFVPAEGVTRKEIIARHEEYLELLIANQLPIEAFEFQRIKKVQKALEVMELAKNPMEKAKIIKRLFNELGLQAKFEITA